MEHPLRWIEIIEHSLNLYENGVIELEHLAIIVCYVSRVLGLDDVSEEVKKNHRKAVRHAIRIIDNYLKSSNKRLPVVTSITIDELAKILMNIIENK
ncbi:MAG: hypothetical protein QXK54_04445 [Ignisphaera sp.]|uniref:Uncharacterized protein n=1 Tax=Ignisphaera aggregans TaxID=334771 RepID=A0A7C4H6J0_9CREN